MGHLILADRTYQILPSLLAADTMRLGEEVQCVMQAGADMIHLDVMDNHYVPNLTFGPIVCRALHQQQPTIPIDVHLMVTPVDSLIAEYIEAGAQRISIHPDATIHLDRSLQLIRTANCQVGLALNPAASLECLTWCAHQLDYVLIMTVNPGFGGQHLIPAMYDKIATLHQLYPHLSICVDGGVNIDNIGRLAAAGATQFIAGTAIFGTADYKQTLIDMRKKLSKS